MEETAQNFEKQFFINRYYISLPTQNFMSHIEILKFCQNHWSLLYNHAIGKKLNSKLRIFYEPIGADHATIE